MSGLLGLDHFRVGPGLPVLAVVGEEAYRASLIAPGLYRFAKVGLPMRATPEEMASVLSKLKSRAVVLWPGHAATGLAVAKLHAQVLAECGAAAVNFLSLPASWPTDFQLGDDLPSGVTPNEIAAHVNAALRDAVALALPIHDATQPNRSRAIVPALTSVDGAQLFARLRAFLAAHLAEPPTAIDTIALWCLHAWAYEAFDVSPRLILHASDPRADHARALRLIAWLTPSPLVVSRTIAAHLLPVIAADRPTLLLDDVGGTMLGYIDMRALIAAGALKDGAFLGRPHAQEPERLVAVLRADRDRDDGAPARGRASARDRRADVAAR